MTYEVILNSLLQSKVEKIKLLAMDVDGVLTDGKLHFDTMGGEGKQFHVSDGLGLTLLYLAGIPTAWISGRASSAVDRRASELKGVRLFASVRDKRKTLFFLAKEFGLELSQIAYIGDDLNDIPALKTAGLAVAVSNASSEVKSAADYVTEMRGGESAVREVCELILRHQGILEKTQLLYIESLHDSDILAYIGQ